MLPMLSFSYCQFAIALRAFAMFFILVVLLPRVVAQDPQATAQGPPLSKLEPLKFCSLGGPFVHIPSASAGAEGLLVRVSPPALARYSKGAPIAVHMFASRPSVSESFMCLNQQGFVDVGFLCPGGEYRHPDGTVWKSGGRNSGTPYADAQACVEPLADVLSFATGKTRSLDGKSIQDYVGAVRAMTDNAGVVGYSYGGNLAILAMARHGERFPGLKWYASWESPILGPVDWFGVTFQPNPFYDPTTGKIDFDRLRYSPEMPLWVWPVQGHPRPEWPHGGLYLDGDRNGRLNKDADYGFWVDVVPGPPLKAFYPLDVTREALGRKVFGDKWSAHIATLQEVEERESRDDARRHISAAVKKLPGLTVLIFEHQINHGGQGRTGVAADHPHAIAQVNAWLDAHARWVRFNPDLHYVEGIMGRKPSHDVQFPAGRRLDRGLIRNSLEPEADAGGPTENQGMTAAACELADRTYSKNWAPVLNRVLVQHKPKVP